MTVAPGQTRDIEFVADVPGDWAIHCHRRHHPMNAMSHEIPNLVGVKQGDVEVKIRALLPNYMAMGESGMHEMAEMHMEGPPNTLPMMGGEGPFGSIGMGGMFTVLKVHDGITSYEDSGWYEHPEGTVAGPVDPLQSQDSIESSPAGVTALYTCPMHPEVVEEQPGTCPACGMKLVHKK